MRLSAHVHRLAVSLIRESRLHIIDTEGGPRLSEFCAISTQEPRHQSECLSLHNNEVVRRKNSRQGSRSPYGNWLSYRQMLAAINEYFRSSCRGSVLIGHSAIGADSRHLTAGLLRAYQQGKSATLAGLAHSRIVGYIDTLPLFRRLYPRLKSYKQKDLVRYFLGVVAYKAHNALDDSLMLYSLWSKYLWPLAKDNFDLLAWASVSNLYCVDRYLKKGDACSAPNIVHFNETCSPQAMSPRAPKQIQIYPTQKVLTCLYPSLNQII